MHVLSDRQVQSLEVLASSIKSKEHYHECLVRFGYHMPALKSSICTLDYLTRVKAGKVYCPMTADVRLKACPRPPSQKVLLEMLKEAAAEDECDLGILKNKEPDLRWMLEVLATMRPDCYIFEKGYVPALVDREAPKDVSQAVDNAEGF